MQKINFVKIYVSVFVLAAAGGLAGYFLGVGLDAPEQTRPDIAQTSHSVFVEESLTIDAIEKVNPSVVSIVASKQLAAMRRPVSLFDLFGSEFGFGMPGRLGQPDGINRSQEADTPDLPRQKVGGGTGFIISTEGLVLTNKHVIDDATAEYSVVLADGNELYAKVLSKDPLNDIAFVQLFMDEDLSKRPSGLSVVSLGDSDSLSVGSKVIAIGNALSEFDNTTTSGIISGLGRSITASNGMGTADKLSNLLQTDASINPGNSGGPLVNLNGEVIGINTAIAQSANGIGFAIPINEAKNLVEAVLEYGKIVRPMLGVRYVEINPQIAEQLDLDVDYGAFLQDDIASGFRAVVKGGPADEAGLRSGDIILAINDVPINRETSLQKQVSRYKPKQKVNLKVWRDAKQIEVEVELGEFEVEFEAE